MPALGTRGGPRGAAKDGISLAAASI